MNIYKSGQDYLETILMIRKTKGVVRSIDIAEKLNYSKPSVSTAMKMLKNDGYIEIASNKTITLTQKGEDIAQQIYERHILLTELLENLGVEKEIAAKDACKIEHDLSHESFEAIKHAMVQYKKSYK